MSQKSKLNFVAEAQIWKDHLETEREAARKWPKRWGFLLTSVEELVKDEKKQPAKPKILLPEHLQIRPVTPVEKYIKVHAEFKKRMAARSEELVPNIFLSKHSSNIYSITIQFLLEERK